MHDHSTPESRTFVDAGELAMLAGDLLLMALAAALL